MLIIGSRGSALALAQTTWVKGRILSLFPDAKVGIKVIQTAADRDATASIRSGSATGVFVKEIEQALLAGEIDLAVHSMKDLPTRIPEGLQIAAVPEREDAQDALIAVRGEEVSRLPQGCRVGTGSVRRVAQLTRLFPGARFTPIRGNLDTRLRKLDEGDYDAVVLAAAGLRRLGCGERISLLLPASACLPAPGQGIVAIEVRADDHAVMNAVKRIDDPAAGAALLAERSVVEALGGGCQTPIGALARFIEEDLELAAAVIAVDGTQVVRAKGTARPADAVALGARVAGELLEQGAGDILADARRTQGAVEGIQP